MERGRGYHNNKRCGVYRRLSIEVVVVVGSRRGGVLEEVGKMLYV